MVFHHCLTVCSDRSPTMMNNLSTSLIAHFRVLLKWHSFICGNSCLLLFLWLWEKTAEHQKKRITSDLNRSARRQQNTVCVYEKNQDRATENGGTRAIQDRGPQLWGLKVLLKGFLTILLSDDKPVMTSSPKVRGFNIHSHCQCGVSEPHVWKWLSMYQNR